MSKVPHYVYVLATVKDGQHSAPTKIGISRNPRSRLLSLQSASPHQLEIAFVFAVDGMEQAQIIERLALGNWGQSRFRLKGEWVDALPAHVVNSVATCVEFVRCDRAPLFSQARQILLDRFGVTDAHRYVQKHAPEIFAEHHE